MIVNQYRKFICSVLLIACFGQAGLFAQRSEKGRTANPPQYVLTKDDEAFLEDLEKRAFLFFWEQSDPKTGLTLDRAHTDGTPPAPKDNHYRVASIASTGFSLSRERTNHPQRPRSTVLLAYGFPTNRLIPPCGHPKTITPLRCEFHNLSVRIPLRRGLCA